jgi:hypothetical protein
MFSDLLAFHHMHLVPTTVLVPEEDNSFHWCVEGQETAL